MEITDVMRSGAGSRREDRMTGFKLTMIEILFSRRKDPWYYVVHSNVLEPFATRVLMTGVLRCHRLWLRGFKYLHNDLSPLVYMCNIISLQYVVHKGSPENTFSSSVTSSSFLFIFYNEMTK